MMYKIRVSVYAWFHELIHIHEKGQFLATCGSNSCIRSMVDHVLLCITFSCVVHVLVGRSCGSFCGVSSCGSPPSGPCTPGVHVPMVSVHVARVLGSCFPGVHVHPFLRFTFSMYYTIERRVG